MLLCHYVLHLNNNMVFEMIKLDQESGTWRLADTFTITKSFSP
jgi:hypothetical protein